ncbi:SRPBCC domain-containing protein [Asanoa sp. NPDC049573]|uniref:SRPBCC domain-containing protein n=1 Tax=Asanoa sp. NPDC049573 TaxID=3155396 RepID=UPI00341E476B
MTSRGYEDSALPPIVRELVVPVVPTLAFDLFTGRIGEWWPRRFTAGGDDLAGVVLEPHVGGRVYERDRDGSEHEWGEVGLWELSRRVALRWTHGLRTPGATLVDVSFEADGTATDVRLEHSGWHADQGADHARFDADGGWTEVLETYRAHATR